MLVNFSNFFKLAEMCEVNIQGAFNQSWGGGYHRPANDSDTIPVGGSGLTVGKPNLNVINDLPSEISKLADQKGFIYCIVSDSFPILYVGVSTGDLRTGVFGGGGRLRHHIRKLLASVDSGTNHTEGWRHHAGVRYDEYKSITASGGDINWVDDVYISIAQADHPKLIEGTVLDCYVEQLVQQKIEVEVLNKGGVARAQAEVRLPKNILEVLRHRYNLNETSKQMRKSSAEVEATYQEHANFASDDDGQLFSLVLRWARNCSDVEMVEGVIDGYTNQPRGYSSIPVVRFAELGKAGKARPNRWLCRIPLKTSSRYGMTVILPKRLMKSTISPDLIDSGKDPNFRPLDLNDFLRDPSRYLSLS